MRDDHLLTTLKLRSWVVVTHSRAHASRKVFSYAKSDDFLWWRTCSGSHSPRYCGGLVQFKTALERSRRPDDGNQRGRHQGRRNRLADPTRQVSFATFYPVPAVDAGVCIALSLEMFISVARMSGSEFDLAIG